MEETDGRTEEGSCWRDVDDVLASGITRMLLYGPSGTGKTFAALHRDVTDGPAERLVCTEDLTSGEITGTWMPSGEHRWEWREGPAIRAWRGSGGVGDRLVVDEVDRASGDALSTLLAVTDSPESARWRNPETNEWVRPGPRFSVVLTSNVDDVSEIAPSLLDRFPVRIRIDRPHPTSVMSLSEDLRTPALLGSLGPLERRVSLRGFFAFDVLRRHVGAQRAAQLVFGADAGRNVLDALCIGALS